MNPLRKECNKWYTEKLVTFVLCSKVISVRLVGMMSFTNKNNTFVSLMILLLPPPQPTLPFNISFAGFFSATSYSYFNPSFISFFFFSKTNYIYTYHLLMAICLIN